MAIDYKKAGVDVETGDRFVEWIQSSGSAHAPHKDRVLEGIGGFASLFRIGFPEMKKPCLVTCTDGVGTKVLLASRYKDFSGVGQDLVAMCVNDLACTGGRPLLFLDYYATGKLDLNDAKAFLASVRKACDDSGCALVGGETAEMPGVYQPGDFDCAGFAVGIVDEEAALGAHRVKAGDTLIAVESAGFHSNGYSLLRKVFENDLDEWKSVLLKPTALYAAMMTELVKTGLIQAAAHITGGGMENVPRVLPEGHEAILTPWDFPAPFKEVQKRAGLTDVQIANTLNCGIGFVLVTRPHDADAVMADVARFNFKTWKLGDVRAGAPGEPRCIWGGGAG